MDLDYENMSMANILRRAIKHQPMHLELSRLKNWTHHNTNKVLILDWKEYTPQKM